jgi:hypothetical protein
MRATRVGRMWHKRTATDDMQHPRTKIVCSWVEHDQGFNTEMWQPFQDLDHRRAPAGRAGHVRRPQIHPARTDARSLPLWEQRLAEWIASQE